MTSATFRTLEPSILPSMANNHAKTLKKSSKPRVKFSHPSSNNARRSSASTRISVTIQQQQHRRSRQNTTSTRLLAATTHQDIPQCEHIDDILSLPGDDGEPMIHDDTMHEPVHEPVHEHQVPPDDKTPPVSLRLDRVVKLTQRHIHIAASPLSGLAPIPTAICR